MSRNAARLFVLLLALACAQVAGARSSDRNKVMTVEADNTTTTTDGSAPTVLSGNVVINQGTLHVEAAKAVLSSNGGDISRAVLTGSQARLEQELDDGTPMSAVANKIDYDMNTEIVVLTGNVFIKQPRNSLRGDRVVYNMRTGQVTSGGQGSGRVKMRILPKGGAATTPADTGAENPTDADSGSQSPGPSAPPEAG